MLPPSRAGARRAVRARRAAALLRAARAQGLRGPSVTLSRTHPNLVSKLFALEVPEIASGAVEIAAIAREAGHRSKIAVTVAPAGRERQGRLHRPDGQPGPQRDERAARREDRHRGLLATTRRSSSPTRCRRPGCRRVNVIDAAARVAQVIVPDYQLSLAIGKEGQNARLAARLTGWRIDIRPDAAVREPRPPRPCRAPAAAGPAVRRAAAVRPQKPDRALLAADARRADTVDLSAVMATRAEQHVPGMPVMRTCVGCKERAVKSSLLRLVAAGDAIQPDLRARLPGRGAYLHPSRRAWNSRGGAGRSPGPCALRDRSASNHWLSIFAARNPRHSITGGGTTWLGSTLYERVRNTCRKAGREADERSMSTRR